LEQTESGFTVTYACMFIFIVSAWSFAYFHYH